MRFRNVASGVTVTVRDGHPGLGRGWDPVDGNQPTGTDYNDLTVQELKDEIRDRNDTRDDADRLQLTGSKAELVASLESDD